MRFEVTVTGVDALLKEADRIGGVVKRKAEREVVKWAMNVAADAKRACPVGETGNLRAGIQPIYDGLWSSVIVNSKYGPFVEFGTGRAGAATHGELPDAGYTHGPSAGMRARPFFFPAARRRAPKTRANLQRILDNPDAA